MTEVLPCPFCGGDKPYVYGPTCNKKTPYNPADRAFPWVTCGQCYAVVPGKDWDESKESAIANWNRRAHLSQPQPVAQGWSMKTYGTLSDGTKLYTIPTGHSVVPVDPTDAMVIAALSTPLLGQFYPGHTAEESESANWSSLRKERFTQIYKAMIAAAPEAGGV